MPKHPFSKYLLNTECVSGDILETGVIGANKIDKRLGVYEEEEKGGGDDEVMVMR